MECPDVSSAPLCHPVVSHLSDVILWLSNVSSEDLIIALIMHSYSRYREGAMISPRSFTPIESLLKMTGLLVLLEIKKKIIIFTNLSINWFWLSRTHSFQLLYVRSANVKMKGFAILICAINKNATAMSHTKMASQNYAIRLKKHVKSHIWNFKQPLC